MSASHPFHTSCPSCACLSLVDPIVLERHSGYFICPECGLRFMAEEHWIELMDIIPGERAKTGPSKPENNKNETNPAALTPASGGISGDGRPTERRNQPRNRQPGRPVFPGMENESEENGAKDAGEQTGDRAKSKPESEKTQKPAFESAFGHDSKSGDGDTHASLNIPGMLNKEKLEEEFYFLAEDRRKTPRAEPQDKKPKDELKNASNIKKGDDNQDGQKKISGKAAASPTTKEVIARKVSTINPVRSAGKSEQFPDQTTNFKAVFEQPVEAEQPRRFSTRGGPKRHEAAKKSQNSLDDLAAPVELETDDRTPLLKTLVPLVVCAMLLCLLFLQYFIFHIEKFRENSPGMVQAVCKILPCSTPPTSSADDYQSRLLQIRSHPTEQNALRVFLAFSNSSGRDVPFPNVELIFYARDNATVMASRKFLPYEYLPRDTTRPEVMPAGTQLQIELDIQDPGPDAVNYIVRFSR